MVSTVTWTTAVYLVPRWWFLLAAQGHTCQNCGMGANGNWQISWKSARPQHGRGNGLKVNICGSSSASLRQLYLICACRQPEVTSKRCIQTIMMNCGLISLPEKLAGIQQGILKVFWKYIPLLKVSTWFVFQYWILTQCTSERSWTT